MASPTKWTATTTAFFGVWLLSASFLLGAPTVDRWNDALVGSAILVAAGYNYARVRRGGGLRRHVTAINGLLGGWLLVAPFLFGVSGLRLWNDVAVGIAVSSLALYNIYAAPRIRDADARARPEET